MAKKATNIVTVAKGTLYAAKKGDRTGFNTLNDAIAKVFRCCGPDCCENVYRWIDKKDNKTCYVQYVFCGELVFELESVYKEKKASGFFTKEVVKEKAPVKEVIIEAQTTEKKTSKKKKK